MAILTLSCCSGHALSPLASNPDSEIAYADLLTIEDLGHDATICSIRDPWGSNRIVTSYILIPEDEEYWNETTIAEVTRDRSESILLRTPLKHMAITSACHAWLMLQLEAQSSIAILCDTNYIISQDVRQWMRTTDENKQPIIADGGTAMAPNKEVLISHKCDGLWMSPYENIGIGNLKNLNIPIIYCADYMETSPLGRAEWMRFYGRLVNKGAQADSLFCNISARYSDLADNNANGKKLLCELPYGANWFVPGGCSTAANLYRDAGFCYLWSEDNHAGSLTLSREAVFAKGKDCDIWLIKYNDPNGDWTLEDLNQQNVMYKHIKAFAQGEVYGCNTSQSDFFDVTPFRPDSLLLSLTTMDGHFFRQLK